MDRLLAISKIRTKYASAQQYQDVAILHDLYGTPYISMVTKPTPILFRIGNRVQGTALTARPTTNLSKL